MPKKMFLFFFLFFRLNKQDGENVFRGESFGHNHYCDYCCGYPCVKMISLYCKYYLYLFLYICVCWRFSIYDLMISVLLFFSFNPQSTYTVQNYNNNNAIIVLRPEAIPLLFITPARHFNVPPPEHTTHTHTHHPRFCLSIFKTKQLKFRFIFTL